MQSPSRTIVAGSRRPSGANFFERHFELPAQDKPLDDLNGVRAGRNGNAHTRCIHGIWLALPLIALGVATIVAVVGTVLTWRMPKPRWVCVLALAATLGAIRYNSVQPHFDQTTLATYNDQLKSVIVEGVVASEPDARDAYTNLRVEADHLLISNLSEGVTRTVKGPMLV